MAERHMSDKQCNCIAWICNTLGIEYNGTTSSYDAWKFISENKPLADKKMENIEANKKALIQKDPERAADSFVLHAMAAVGYSKYSCTWDARSREFSNEFDGINLDDDLINTIGDENIPALVYHVEGISGNSLAIAIHVNEDVTLQIVYEGNAGETVGEDQLAQDLYGLITVL